MHGSRTDQLRAIAGLICMAAAALMAFAVTAATTIYRCTGASGSVAYQAQPCENGEAQRRVAIAPPPAYAPSPRYAVPSASPRHGGHHASRRRRPLSYECRAGDGEVFYRHDHCPAVIPRSDGGRGRVHVSARRIPRAEACAQIHRAGAIGRRGHERDQRVSAYDHDLGRDPCS